MCHVVVRNETVIVLTTHRHIIYLYKCKIHVYETMKAIKSKIKIHVKDLNLRTLEWPKPFKNL